MSEFFNKLKQKPMSYADLQSAYNDLKTKSSEGKLSPESQQDLGMLTSIFGRTEQSQGNSFDGPSIFSNGNQGKNDDDSLDKKMFDGVSKGDGSLSYDELVGLKDMDFKVYKNSGDEYPYTYDYQKQSLAESDARKARRLITRSSNMPEGSEFKPYYFDEKKQPLSDAQLKQNAENELSKTIDYFKKNDFVFKDANGNEVNLRNVINNFEKDGYRFEVVDDSELPHSKAVIDTKDKKILFNQSAFNLTSKDNVDATTGLNKGFEKTFIHEIMHYNDMKTNSNGDIADFSSKFIYNKEAYAEGSAINAVEQLNGNPNAMKSSTYQEYEPIFLGGYRGRAMDSLQNFQLNSTSKFLSTDDKGKKSLFEEMQKASDNIKRVEDSKKNIKPLNFNNIEL